MTTKKQQSREFASGHSRARWITVLFTIIILIDLIMVIFGWLEVQLLNRALEGEIITEKEALSNDTRIGFIGFAYLIVYISTAILFLMWIHRAHRNLPALGMEGLRYSPGWAVGGFFVPILSLFRPFQVVTEIWKASDPKVDPDDSTDWQNAQTSPVVISWWLLYILTGLLSWTVFRLSWRAESLEEMLTSSWLYVIINFIEIPAIILAIKVVLTIDHRQLTKNRLINPIIETAKDQNRGVTTMKKMIFIGLASLLAGTGFGYFFGYSNFMPVIEDYIAQIDNKNTEISQLTHMNSSLEQLIFQKEAFIQNQKSQISGLEAESADLRVQISSWEEQYASLESDYGEAQNQIDDYEQELSEKRKNIISLGNRINEILSIDVPQFYKWTYGGNRELNVDITLSSYVNYSEKPRPTEVREFADMVKESRADPTIKALVSQLREEADSRRMGDRQLADYVASFVQSMPYTLDYDTTGRDEYPRYPVETLFDRGGDCEDTSILISTLLDSLGINVVLLHLEGEHHIALGVDVPMSYGIHYEYIGTKYWYLETTAEGWRIGNFPTEFKDDRAYIYPVW